MDVGVKTVYVAGPYSSDPVTNTRRAVEIAEQILKAGFLPIVPHLSIVWDLISPHDPNFWYQYDLDIMHACADVVFRFPGESRGADIEVNAAHIEGIPVVVSVEQLCELNETAT
jgi:hypothetical protein